MSKAVRKKKSFQPQKELVANFEREEPLVRKEVDCTICFCILLDPVTFPCKHSICNPCFNTFIRETSLCCPLCRLRISVWSRKAIKENSLVNVKFKERLEAEFPNEIENRRREVEAIDNRDNLSIPFDESMFDDFTQDDNEGPVVRDHQFAQPGEIAMDYAAIYKSQQEEFDKERIAAEQASQALISQLMEEDPILSQQASQMESDFKLAKHLYASENKQIQEDRRQPALRSQNIPQQMKLRSKQTTPFLRKSQSAIKSTKPSPVASRAISKSTQRRLSAPTKRKSTGNSSFSGGCGTPKSGGGSAKQTKIATYFTKSPVTASSHPAFSPRLADCSTSSPQQTSFASIGNVPSSTPGSPTSIFANLSIFSQETSLMEFDINNVYTEVSEDSGLGAPLVTVTSDDNDLDSKVNIIKNESEEENDKTDFFSLPVSQLSSLGSERGVTADSDASLDLNEISDRYREEEFILQDLKNRINQEEQDRKIAVQLQNLYRTGQEPRGVLSTSQSEKYPIRAWRTRQPAATQKS